jgi:hypothetical protein
MHALRKYVVPTHEALLSRGVPLSVARRAYELLHYAHCNAYYPGDELTHPNRFPSVDGSEFLPDTCDLVDVLKAYGFTVLEWNPKTDWGNFYIRFTYDATNSRVFKDGDDSSDE